MNYGIFETMAPILFQNSLHACHIIVVGSNFLQSSWLLSLKGMKEIVDIKSTYLLSSINWMCADHISRSIWYATVDKWTIKDLIENLDDPGQDIFQIISMRSYAGMEPSPFSSDHSAWWVVMCQLRLKALSWPCWAVGSWGHHKPSQAITVACDGSWLRL
jgi:hypothetical protein